MFFEVLNLTYHSPITIESPTYGRLPLYSSVFVHTRSVAWATRERPSAIRDSETPILSAEASDTGLVSAAAGASFGISRTCRFARRLCVPQRLLEQDPAAISPRAPRPRWVLRVGQSHARVALVADEMTGISARVLAQVVLVVILRTVPG